jgi:hypothetical protein
MDKIELGLYFCSDPDCVLHVCSGDPGVTGEGNWAVLPCGAMIGRGIYDSRYYCDRCGTGRIGTRSGIFYGKNLFTETRGRLTCPFTNIG